MTIQVCTTEAKFWRQNSSNCCHVGTIEDEGLWTLGTSVKAQRPDFGHSSNLIAGNRWILNLALRCEKALRDLYHCLIFVYFLTMWCRIFGFTFYNIYRLKKDNCELSLLEPLLVAHVLQYLWYSFFIYPWNLMYNELNSCMTWW